MTVIDMPMPKACAGCDLLMDNPLSINGYCAKTKSTIPIMASIVGRPLDCPLSEREEKEKDE